LLATALNELVIDAGLVMKKEKDIWFGLRPPSWNLANGDETNNTPQRGLP
jgi:hypothetical protein